MINFHNNGEISFEGNIIKGEKNGKGKEFDEDGHIIFEGEYKDDIKWNGIRKDYSDGKLIFEAEIKDRKIIYSKFYEKNNNILEYKNGTGYTRKYCLLINNSEYLEFEGEFIDGVKNGKGKEYNIFNKLEFEGEYLNGERQGKGKEYDINGSLIFEGEYINGKRKN